MELMNFFSVIFPINDVIAISKPLSKFASLSMSEPFVALRAPLLLGATEFLIRNLLPSTKETFVISSVYTLPYVAVIG